MKTELSEKEIKKLRDKLFSFGLSKRLYYEEAEDFAQEAIIEILQNPKKRNFGYLYVDYLRKLFGRKDTNGNTNNFEFVDIAKYENKLPAEIELPDTHYRLDYYVKTLNWYERKLLFYLLRGETLNEMSKKERHCVPVIEQDIAKMKRKMVRLAYA